MLGGMGYNFVNLIDSMKSASKEDMQSVYKDHENNLSENFKSVINDIKSYDVKVLYGSDSSLNEKILKDHNNLKGGSWLAPPVL